MEDSLEGLNPYREILLPEGSVIDIHQRLGQYLGVYIDGQKVCLSMRLYRYGGPNLGLRKTLMS